MKAVRTNELEAGMFAALVMDTPNAGGVQVTRQGIIEKIEAADMYGVPSEHLQLIHFRKQGSTNPWDIEVITVNNSHLWLVRTI
jgi:hypothetical protein